MHLIYNSYFDYALPYQLGFQDPASPLMHGLINLHHFIMFFLIIIVFFVFIMMYFILTTFTVHLDVKGIVEDFFIVKDLAQSNFTHHTAIEVI